MLSQQQLEMREKEMMTPNELAKICGISRRTIQRIQDRGLLTPAMKDEHGRCYYSMDDAMQIRSILTFTQFGFSTAQIKAFLQNNTMHNLIGDYYGNLLHFLHVLEADQYPFSLFSEGQIFLLKKSFITLNRPYTFEMDCQNAVGWDSMIFHIHQALIGSAKAGFLLDHVFALAEASFTEDGTPITHKILIPHHGPEESEPTVGKEPHMSFYAAWYGPFNSENANNIHKRYASIGGTTPPILPQYEQGPFSVFRAMQKSAEELGYEVRQRCYIRFTRDFYGLKEYDFSLDSYLYIELPLLN